MKWVEVSEEGEVKGNIKDVGGENMSICTNTHTYKLIYNYI